MKVVRAVRTTTTATRIDPTTTPKEIDLTTDMPSDAAVLAVDGEEYKPTGKINKGIYELSGDNLRYCFAGPGMPGPKKFEVRKGSGHTLVVLKRFRTGEADTIAALTALGGDIMLKDGWAYIASFGMKPIVDDDLVLLKKLTKLDTVDLDGTKVTDAGLVHLKEISTLTAVSLHDTAVTDMGLRQFLSDMPSLEWSHTRVTKENPP